jgi:stearoyl-CoA desaturase (delta-9 desaturase)
MKANVVAWFDSHSTPPQATGDNRVAWRRIVPLVVLHLALVAGFWLDVTPIDLAVCAALYALRMFAITGFYHRYFSHKSFSTGRAHQFLWAIIGASATQRGPLWWAANHREHHKHSDTDADPHHSERGFWWSHIKWFLVDEHYGTKTSLVKDLARFPELVWLDRFDIAVPLALAALLYGIGELLAWVAPSLQTNGLQLLFWGYVVSTLVLLHATLAINSLAHRMGKQVFDTKDRSKNSFLLALVTFGEGWHNNHHRYCGSTRQGFVWWEVDLTFYVLKLMQALRLVRDLRPVPERVLAERRMTPGTASKEPESAKTASQKPVVEQKDVEPCA